MEQTSLDSIAQGDSNILTELNTIVRALTDNFFQQFFRIENRESEKNQLEKKIEEAKIIAAAYKIELPDDISKLARLRDAAPSIKTSILEFAIADMDNVLKRYPLMSEYAVSAVKEYHDYIQKLRETGTATFIKCVKPMAALSNLELGCGIKANSYQDSIYQTNECRTAIYGVFNASEELIEVQAIDNLLNGGAIAESIAPLMKALESRLRICSACPYMEYGRQHPRATVQSKNSPLGGYIFPLIDLDK